LNLLLDSHALYWILVEPEKLSAAATAATIDPDNTVFVSSINTWELAIKAGLGRLDLPFDEVVPSIHRLGFKELPVTISHSLAVRGLPNHHRDPFDRLLVAQAICEGLVVVTRDPEIARYPVEMLWD